MYYLLSPQDRSQPGWRNRAGYDWGEEAFPVATRVSNFLSLLSCGFLVLEKVPRYRKSKIPSLLLGRTCDSSIRRYIALNTTCPVPKRLFAVITCFVRTDERGPLTETDRGLNTRQEADLVFESVYARLNLHFPDVKL
jgi:hypothetical protein